MRRPIAFVLVRDPPHYRRQAFVTGLAACGFDVRFDHPHGAGPDDVLLIWNRYGQAEQAARTMERAGGRVLVSENGYLGADAEGRQLYALALDGHNGSGRWHVGAEDRWSPLGIELAPWREDGRHVLVLPQRGIGPAGIAMPEDWTRRTVARLERETLRPIKLRPHPGTTQPETTLEQDLAGAWCAVTWGSGSAIKALVAGIPVFHELETWIGAPAARYLPDWSVALPLTGDRLPMLRRLAHAQWTIAEIAAGLPFRLLLEDRRAAA